MSLTLEQIEAFDPHPWKRGRETRFLCPLPGCHGDRKRDNAHRSLSVNADGVYYCHRCQAKGTFAGKPQTPRKTQQRPVERRSSWQPPKAPTDRQTDYDFASIASRRQPIEGTAALRYLQSRRLDLEAVRAAGVMAINHQGHRAAFPLHVEDQLSGLVLRLAGDGDPKTLTYAAIEHGVFLTAGALDAKVVAIVEAPIDALSLHPLPAIATNGTNWKRWLDRHMFRKTVLLAHDADQAGDKAAEHAAQWLQAAGARCWRFKPSNQRKDWNEMLQLDGAKAIEQAIYWALVDIDAETSLPYDN